MKHRDGQFLVGWISPTNRPEGRETQLDSKIPSTIRVLNVNLNFTRGTEEEFRASMPAYEAKLEELAAMRADLILPSGAPPFMLLGFGGERNIVILGKPGSKCWLLKVLTSPLPMFPSCRRIGS